MPSCEGGTIKAPRPNAVLQSIPHTASPLPATVGLVDFLTAARSSHGNGIGMDNSAGTVSRTGTHAGTD